MEQKRPLELIKKLGFGTFVAHYLSGKKIRFRGTLFVLRFNTGELAGYHAPLLRPTIPHDSDLYLDPRVKIYLDTQLVYSPHDWKIDPALAATLDQPK